jgi:hypothetical protein
MLSLTNADLLRYSNLVPNLLQAFSTAKASLSKQFWDAVVDERQSARSA